MTAQELYEIFIAATAPPMHRVPWPDLPQLVRDAWAAVATAQRIQSQETPNEKDVSSPASPGNYIARC